MIIRWIKKHKLIFFVLIAYLVTGLNRIDILRQALSNTLMYLVEMLEILPAVFILTGLINAWIPSAVIVKNFGHHSGLKGKLMSFVIGSLSAGPIYAAFPLAQSLLVKGASIGNIVIIISSWAVIKIPMLIVESKFLGLPFAFTRYLLTIPGIVLLSIACEKMVGKKEIDVKIKAGNSAQIGQIEKVLPGLNCGSCGYGSCMEYAEAIFKKEAAINQCKPGGNETAIRLQTLLE